jgi:hypothetical protein
MLACLIGSAHADDAWRYRDIHLGAHMTKYQIMRKRTGSLSITHILHRRSLNAPCRCRRVEGGYIPPV